MTIHITSQDYLGQFDLYALL